jgi:hypothetical protein
VAFRVGHLGDALDVRMQVDEAGRDDLAAGIDDPPGPLAGQLATRDRDDALATHRDVGAEPDAAGPVDHLTSRDQDVIGRRLWAHAVQRSENEERQQAEPAAAHRAGMSGHFRNPAELRPRGWPVPLAAVLRHLAFERDRRSTASQPKPTLR